MTDLAIDRDGTLHAVEISAIGLQRGPGGAVVAVAPGASEHGVVRGALPAPYGIAFSKRAM